MFKNNHFIVSSIPSCLNYNRRCFMGSEGNTGPLFLFPVPLGNLYSAQHFSPDPGPSASAPARPQQDQFSDSQSSALLVKGPCAAVPPVSPCQTRDGACTSFYNIIFQLFWFYIRKSQLKISELLSALCYHLFLKGLFLLADFALITQTLEDNTNEYFKSHSQIIFFLIFFI